MNFKLIEAEINEKDFPDQKEFSVYITKNEMLKIKEEKEVFEILNILNINTGNQGIYFFNLKDNKTDEYKLAFKLKKKYRVNDNAVYIL